MAGSIPCSVVLLDQRLVGAMSAWPPITVELVARVVARAQTLAVALAISCITGLELRLHVLLWHLADRFGACARRGLRFRYR
jgi:hypothetical protein